MQDITKQLSMADSSGSASKEELYACNSCALEIPQHLARVTCHSCQDHHLCANCQVIKNFYPPHTKSHSAMVFRESGIVVPIPPGFTKKPPALPPRPKSVFGIPATTGKEPELGAADWSALWSIVKAPLEKKNKKFRGESIDDKGILEMFEVRDVTGRGVEGPVASGGAGLPPSPPKSLRRGLSRVDSSAANVPSYPQPEKWEALFEKESTPTPIFVALMSTIFSDLDTEHTGFLCPETYSNFLDAQGSVENIWKQALDKAEGENGKDIADFELGLYFTDLSISHTLKVRMRDTADAADEEPQTVVEGKPTTSIRFNSNMPMISRQGFIDVCAIEYLKDPNKGHQYLAKVVKAFGVWEELGDLPREVLPSSKSLAIDTKMQDKFPDYKSEQKETSSTKSIASIKSTGSLKLDTTQRSPGDDSKSTKRKNSGTSDISTPIEIRRLASPIALGAPVMTWKLKGGESKISAVSKAEEFESKSEESKIDAVAKGKEHSPSREDERTKKDISEDEKVSGQEEPKVESHGVKEVVAEKKIDETASKKSSVEDLYSSN